MKIIKERAIRWKFVLFLSAVLTPMASPAASQERAPRPEQVILSKIHETNQMEIKLGELAQKKASQQDVRDYGERLERDHKVADSKVTELAKKQGVELIKPKPQTEKEKEFKEKQKQTAEKLQGLQGREFERVYLQAMVEGHTHSIETLRDATKKLKDEDVQSLVKDLNPILEQHLELAKQLQKGRKAASALQ